MGRAYRVTVEEGDRIRAGLAMQLVALPTGVAAETMMSPERLALRPTRARWLAMYLAHIAFGWPLERVGHAFGVNRNTVSNGCRWAEDARDNPQIDALLDQMETMVRELCETPRPDLAA